MKNHRFLWLRNRTTDNRKCEKARNIKEKRTIEMFNTVSKQLDALRSSPRDNHSQGFFSRDAKANLSNISPQTKHTPYAPPAGFFVLKQASPPLRTKRNGGDAIYNSILLCHFCAQQV